MATKTLQIPENVNINVDESVAAMLIAFGLAPVYQDSDGSTLADGDGTIFLNE